MRIRLDLYATATGEFLCSVPLAGSAIVNPARRLVGGLAAPWNVLGSPSVGPAIFRPSSITVPEDKTWVKLLQEHDPNRSVGYLHDSADTSAGLIAALRVVDGAAGDAALEAVGNHTRDALSVRVEVDDWIQRESDNVFEIRASRLREISLVAVPAYAPARANVLASIPTQEREKIMGQLRSMLDLSASAPLVPPTGQTPPEGQGSPDTGNPPAAPATGSPQTPPSAVTAALDPASFAAALAPHLARIMPGGQIPGEPPAGPPTPPRRSGPVNLQAAAEVVVRWQSSGDSNPASLMAALNDVVPANDAGGGSGVGNDVAPQWLGELWTASQSARPYVDALGTPSRLTGLKAKGWRWVTRPVMDDYAGNKAAIPSNAVSTEPAEANAHREAGGWDVDRAFLDLGDAAFVEAMFQAATESWRTNSNTWLGAQLLAAAQAEDVDGLGAAANLTAALGAMASAAAPIGARITWLAIASDIFADFSSLTRDQVPWWFGGGEAVDISGQTANAGGFRMWVDPALPAGTYLGGDRRAATYYEQGATPIRVQAVNIPNGGVDLGVFGYNAVIVNDIRALLWGTVA